MRTARRRRWRLALPVAAFIGGLWVADRITSQPLVQMPASAVNLLVNTDFRKTTKDLPDSWFFDPSLARKGSVRIVPQGSKPGRLALCLNPTSQNKDAAKPLALAQMIYPEPFLGHRLRVQASLQVTTGGNASVHLFALSRGQPVAHAELSQAGSTEGFKVQQSSLMVPANTDQLFFFVATSSSSGSACFEELAVVVTDPEKVSVPKAAGPPATFDSSKSSTLPPVTVSAVAAPAAPVQAEAAGVNILKNADFRRNSNNFPDEWLLDNSVVGKGSVHLDPNGSLPGLPALCLTPNVRNSDKSKPFALAQMITATPYLGRLLTVRASFKVTSGGTAFVHLFAIAGSRPVGEVTFSQTVPSPSFVSQEDSLKVPENTDRLLFAVTTNSVSGSACFDGLFVGEGASVRSAVAGGTPAGSRASIRVNASNVRRKVPAGIFGTNVEWVRNGNTIWDSSTNQPRPEIVTRLREAGTSFIRYPGGGLADHFHWRDSIGPMALRPVRPHVLDPEASKLVFGTAELIRLCRQISAEPLMTVNVTTGTAQEAAEWVSYCNRPDNAERERNGSKSAFNIKYWEIGNEQYIDNPSSGLPSSYLRPEEYARRFLEFAAAMKAADPSIVIGAVGGANFGAYRLFQDDDWNARLLSAAARQIDFLSVHNGYAPAVGNSPGVHFFDVYKAMMAFPAQVEANLAQLSTQLDSYGVASRKTRIAVTEWGPLFAADVRSAWAGHVKTLGAGLYVAGVLNALLRSPRVEIATYLKVTENNYMGWLYPNGNTKPPFQVLQLYREHLGSRLTETQVSSPGFSSPTIGSVAAVSNTPYLDAVSGMDDSGSKLTLIVVNRDFNNVWTTSVQIDGFQVAAKGRAWELTAESLDANNGEDLTADARFNWAQQAQAPLGGMYSKGRPGTVRPKERAVNGLTSRFNYAFPPKSVTVLELVANR